MKKLKVLVLGLLTASLAGALAACTQETAETYTFTFDTMGGSAIAPLELREGEQVTRPADPTHQFYDTFDNWYTGIGSDSAVYAFGTMPAQDVTVYAHWSDPKSSVRVSYESNGGSAVADSIGMVGSAFEQPEAPVREGYVFGGWFSDADCTQRYVFSQFPAESMTLYAQWLPDGAYAYITYFGNGEQLADPVPVLKGSAFTGFAFGDDIVSGDWYTDASYSNPYAGGTVNGDLRLYTSYYTRGLTFAQGVVTGYAGTSQQVVVPDIYDGAPVRFVGEGAFRGDMNIRSVLLPDSVTEVRDSAFLGCQYLVSVNLTSNVTSLGTNVFKDARRLESVGDLSGITVIPEGTFLGCDKLITVTLGANTQSIGVQAFAGCVALREIVIPGGVTSIGAQAFEGCSALTALTLPASLETLGEGALDGCTALESVAIDASNAAFSVEDGNLYHGAELLKYVAGDKEETSFTLPAGKTSVAAYAFENNATLTELIFPDGVTEIERGALTGMSALESLSLPAAVFGQDACLAAFFGAPAVENSGSHSFYIPATLASLTFSGNVTALADYAFYGAVGLSSVTGLSAVERIGDGAFAYTAFTQFEIPASLTQFGARVFEGCSVSAYTVADGNAAYRAYDDCLYSAAGTLVAVPTVKTAIAFPDQLTVTEIGEYAFYDSAIAELEIPDTVTKIGFAAFGNMQSLTDLTVPVIGDGGENDYMGYAFGSEMHIETPDEESALVLSSLIVSLASRLPQNLTTLTVTGTVTAVPDMAFAQLAKLSEVYLFTGEDAVNVTSYGAFSFYNTAVSGDWTFTNVTAIGESAFEGTRLTSVSLPGTLAGNMGTSAFASIADLAGITLGEGITRIAPNAFAAYSSAGETGDDGYTYDVRRSKVDHELVIPSTVTEIGTQAFLGVGTAEFFSPSYPDEQPDAVTHATRNEHFSVTFTDTQEQKSALTSIGAYAFSCSGLQEVVLPAALQTVGQNAFIYNLFLETVVFGNAEDGSALASMDAFVFARDTSLQSVTLYGASVPTLAAGESGDIFAMAGEDFYVYVPSDLVDDYRAAAGWSLVGDRIVAIGTAEGGNA